MAILVTEGKEWIIDKVQDLAPLTNARMNVGVSGTGSAAEAVGNTLLTFVGEETRVTGALTQPTSLTDRLVYTFTYTASKNVTETGRCNNTTGTTAGTHVLLCRALFTAIPVVNLDQIQFTFDHTQ